MGSALIRAAHQESICILLEMQWLTPPASGGEYFHGPFEIYRTNAVYFIKKQRLHPPAGMIVRDPALSNVTRKTADY